MTSLRPGGPEAFAVAAGIFIGSLTAIQSRANGSLAIAVGSGLQAAVISFGVGLVLLTVLAAVSHRLRSTLIVLIRDIARGRVPWWQALGGVFGALFIFSQSASVPTIGVALFAVALVAGQNSASLVVDAVGLGPRGRQPVSGFRVASAVLGILAIFVSVQGRVGAGDLSIPVVLLVVATGIGVAVQQAVNARIVARTGEPLMASYVTFITGGMLLGLLLVVLVVAGAASASPLPSSPAWLYLGGIIGSVWVATAAWVVGRVGVLALGLLTTAGQLLGALALDLLLTDVVDGHLIVGMGMAFLAVGIAPGPRALLRRG